MIVASRKQIELMIVTVLALHPVGGLLAANIDKPAGELPLVSVGGGGKAISAGISKSKVIPVQRKMDIAVGTQKIHPKSTAPSGALPPIATTSKNVEKKPKINENTLPSTDETWDSAAKRYDRGDPAKSISGGVRVEDIIEPTVDYQYSSGRRKNPFIPDIILSGKIARQRELSPNDVEIPIVSPLQSFSVAQLAVIGVWETDSQIWKALIKTPATQGIEAKLGDPVGNSGGRIMSINPESVVVREFSLRVDGTREYRDIPLHMGSDLPQAKDTTVGGRIILRPGSSQPEVLGPDTKGSSVVDSIISTSAAVLPGSSPGTLKTVESVNIPSDMPENPVENQKSGDLQGVNRDPLKDVPPGVRAQQFNPTPNLGGAR